MTIPTISQYTGNIPDRADDTQSEFNTNTSDILTYFGTIAPEINATVAAMNTTAGEVDANATLAQGAADTATAAANANPWNSSTTYDYPDTVIGSDGNSYRALAENTNDNPVSSVTGNWIQITVNPADIFLQPASLEPCRPRFIWNASGVLGMEGPASWYVHGSTTGRAGFAGTTNYTFTGMTASQFYYLYIDVSTLTGATITSSNLIKSTTAPTWNSTKHGWYNGDDICIFAIYAQTATEMRQFYHDGGDLLLWSNPFTSVNAQTLTGSINYTLKIPSFCRFSYSDITLEYDTGTGVLYISAQSDAASGIRLQVIDSTFAYETVNSYLPCDLGGNITATLTANQATLTIIDNGFKFPKGM